MMPILQVGPLAIQLPGLLILAGVWVGSLTIDRQAARAGVSGDRLSKVVFLSLVVGIVAARLGYVLRYLSAYLVDPLGIVALTPQTLSLAEGVVGALLFAWVYGRRVGLPLWPALDALTPMFAIVAVFLGLSHLASGDAFGASAVLPWAIEMWGAARHPSQVYETMAALAVLGAILALRRRALPSGTLFLVWVGLTAFSRLFLEAFRGDSVLVLGGVRSAQVVSLAVLAAVMAGLHARFQPVGRESSGS